MARKFNREILRILLLIPLLVVMGLLFMWQSQPQFEDSFTRYANLAIDSADEPRASSTDYTDSQSRHQPSDWRQNRGSSETNDSHYGVVNSNDNILFEFDPNRVTLNELMQLGFSQKQAQGVLNYRKAGAIFHTAADFGRCYTVSDEKLQQLLPYINIGVDYKTSKRKEGDDYKETSKWSGNKMDDATLSSREGATSVGSTSDISGSRRSRASALSGAETSSGRQATTESSVSSEERTISGPRTSSDSGSDRAADRYFTPQSTDLNSADSAALIKVRGIGALTAQRIIEYRNRMGGFVSIEQLQEIQGMNERNYLSIIQQIFIDSSGITKIDINFALPEQLKGHPYLPSRILNKLLKQRQLKGGWRDTRDLIEQNILSREEAEKLAPYLYFRPVTVRNH